MSFNFTLCIAYSGDLWGLRSISQVTELLSSTASTRMERSWLLLGLFASSLCSVLSPFFFCYINKTLEFGSLRWFIFLVRSFYVEISV
jgi:hypothetical protein